VREQAAGDFDYEAGGIGYAVQRRPDPRIAALIHAGLGAARTVVNVGAGAGSYEPTDRDVTAVEPSAAMRAQRPAHLSAAVDAVAEALPFPDDSFDAAMATVTIHQWPDLNAGLREMRRVARGPVVILTFDPDALETLWLPHYIPELYAADRLRGTGTVTPVPIPIDCTDGFIEAFYARPEALLDPAVRQAQSGWAFVSPEVADRAVGQLRADLESGEWDRRYGALRTQPEVVGAMRLITAKP
jgi:SAM-dependent methyltransferase